MTTMKRLFALMLAVLMLCAVCIASAEETMYMITAPAAVEGVTHNYSIFQIFTGDLTTNANGQTVLINVLWGKNGTGEFETSVEDSVMQALQSLPAGSTDKEKLVEVMKYVNIDDNNAFKTVSSGNYVEVPAGYYLIKDQDKTLENVYDAHTLYIVEVVDDVPMVAKSTKPKVDKQVFDEPEDSENNAADGWGETADHAINETFQFKLIATLKKDDHYAAYTTYKIVFNDTMSSELNFEKIVSVKINNADVSESNYRVEGPTNGQWTLTIPDILTACGQTVDLVNDGATVEVIYEAHLNKDAYVSTPEDKELTDNNKNTVNLTYSNNPNWNGTGEYDGEMGKTPDDSVWVFTYDVEYEKHDDTNNPLAGAGFTLYAGETPIKLSLKEKKDSVDIYYVDPNGIIEQIETSATGKFKIVGLDAGEYTLKETKTPDGYNTCDDLDVSIKAIHNENNATMGASVELTEEDSNEIIINKKGATLPETGGIGTTIFYIAGGVLVLLAVVLLVTKRRMGENN
ncbi:MAG: isopeptide-forming domain-containing fimbrial protein [Clostridia bacterium]|nr:isopeptide-forming domain-containing fimbrial protein [Clostridia bacterium]